MTERDVPKPMPSRPSLYCSFCGKSDDEVGYLVAGPTVFICNECVELCREVGHQILTKKGEVVRAVGETPQEDQGK